MIFTNLLANLVVLSAQGQIQTNTPAFQEYAFRKMFERASNMLTVWNEDIPRPITTNMVTSFDVVGTPFGLSGDMVFSQRFYFNWIQGGVMLFVDKPNNYRLFLTDNVQTNDAVQEQWMRRTNLLTMDEASRIAQNALRSIGIFTNNEPTVKGQRKYVWKDGKTYALPYYEFRWETATDICDLHVSGISSNVAGFSNGGLLFRIETFTNRLEYDDYLTRLGLPTNAVFVKPVHRSSDERTVYMTYPP
jgi:hypothetical protein